MTTFITMPHDPCPHNAPVPLSTQCSLTIVITMHHAIVSTILLRPCNQNAPCPCLTMLHNSFHHNTPWLCKHNAPGPLSPQCLITAVTTMLHALIITMLQNSYHHNAPCPLSSQCSRILVITMFHYCVITMLHGHCHHNAPEFLSSKGSMALSSQCSMSLFLTILKDHFVHYAR